MNRLGRPFTFAWWNLHDFAHHDPARHADPRRPKRAADYSAKRDRVLTAFEEAFYPMFPDLLAVCEITREAADDLTGRLPGGYRLTVTPPYPQDDGFQVAVFYRPAAGLTPEPPILPAEREDVPGGTRPMVPVHLHLPGHLVRFVACHWTAFDTGTSVEARERLADVLRRDAHDFLEPEAPTAGPTRHVVVLGDLNEEPPSPVFVRKLIGRRDRESSHTRHWSDEQVRRVRLYNLAWRYLGEQVPHGAAEAPAAAGPAGTYFRKPHDWRTFDHVLVSSGLLGTDPPFIDESRTGIVSTAIMCDEDGRPCPFEPGRPHGVSDHLPIAGSIILPEGPK